MVKAELDGCPAFDTGFNAFGLVRLWPDLGVGQPTSSTVFLLLPLFPAAL